MLFTNPFKELLTSKVRCYFLTSWGASTSSHTQTLPANAEEGGDSMSASTYLTVAANFYCAEENSREWEGHPVCKSCQVFEQEWQETCCVCFLTWFFWAMGPCSFSLKLCQGRSCKLLQADWKGWEISAKFVRLSVFCCCATHAEVQREDGHFRRKAQHLKSLTKCTKPQPKMSWQSRQFRMIDPDISDPYETESNCRTCFSLAQFGTSAWTPELVK